MHHDDYDRPLDVRALCTEHHNATHHKPPHYVSPAPLFEAEKYPVFTPRSSQRRQSAIKGALELYSKHVIDFCCEILSHSGPSV